MRTREGTLQQAGQEGPAARLGGPTERGATEPGLARPPSTRRPLRSTCTRFLGPCLRDSVPGKTWDSASPENLADLARRACVPRTGTAQWRFIVTALSGQALVPQYATGPARPSLLPFPAGVLRLWGLPALVPPPRCVTSAQLLPLSESCSGPRWGGTDPPHLRGPCRLQAPTAHWGGWRGR